MGCNWRPSKDFVVGIEADGWTSGIKGLAVDGSTPDVTFRTRNRWDADITLRLGMPVDRALLYVKGGAAVGHFDYTLQVFQNSFIGDSTRWGWLVGFGIEYALNYNWSIKAEYNHIDFGSHDVELGLGSPAHVRDTKNIFKVGVNYLFDSGGRPPLVTKY